MLLLIETSAKTDGRCYDCPAANRVAWHTGERITYRNDIRRPICLSCGDRLVESGQAEWKQKDDAPGEAPSQGNRLSQHDSDAVQSIAKSLRRLVEIFEIHLNIEPEGETVSPKRARQPEFIEVRGRKIDAKYEKHIKCFGIRPMGETNVLKAIDEMPRWKTFEEWLRKNPDKGDRSKWPYAFYEEYLPHEEDDDDNDDNVTQLVPRS